LFLNSKLNYTVRAITHLDTFRLDRIDFESVMKMHPAGAVHVADMIQQAKMMPSRVTRKVVEEIYVQAGIKDVLSILQTRRWRPPKGFAQRLRLFAEEELQSLERIRTRAMAKRARNSICCTKDADHDQMAACDAGFDLMSPRSEASESSARRQAVAQVGKASHDRAVSVEPFNGRDGASVEAAADGGGVTRTAVQAVEAAIGRDTEVTAKRAQWAYCHRRARLCCRPVY